MTQNIREEARSLRQDGLSYREISKTLGVAKTTIESWVSDIALTSEQKERLTAKVNSNLNFTGSVKGRKSKKRLDMGEEAWAVLQEKKSKIKLRKSYQKRKLQIQLHNVDYRSNLKRQYIEYKGGKCETCGYNKDCLSAYHFHHEDPTQKEFSISKASHQKRQNNVYAELDKCKLLCSNCHAETHDQIYQRQRRETSAKLKSMIDGSNGPVPER